MADIGYEDPEGHAAKLAGITSGDAQAEDRLPQSAQLYQMLFASHPDGVVLTVEGKIALINDRFAELSGYSTEEAIGMTPSDLVVPEERERAGERVQALLTKGPAFPSTYTFVRKDGTKLPIDALSRPVQHDGKAAIISVVRDISERRRAEEALLRTGERYQHLLEVAPDGIVVVDGAGVIETVNAKTEELFGYGREELVGRSVEMLLPERYREHHTAHRQTYTAAPYVRTMESGTDLYGLRKDGSEFPVDISLNAIQSDAGTNVIAAVRDLSERAEAEKGLRRSEERFKVSLMNTPIVVFEQDSDLRYTWAHNPVPGFTLEDLLGKTDIELLPAGEATRLTELKQQVLRSGKGTREIVEATIDGRLGYHDITIETLLDGEGAIVGITAASFDITERKQAEEALRALEEERYRRLLEVAPDGIVIVNDAGVIETVNARTEELFGYDRKELIGRPVETLMPDRHHQLHTAHRQAYTAAPHARPMGQEMELYGLRKDGNIFPIDVSLNTMRSADGISVIAAVRDVTERVVAEKTLRESEATNRALLMAMPDMIFRLDRDGTYTGFVPGATSEPIVQPSELLGRSVREIIPSLAEEFLQAIGRALDRQDAQTLDYDLPYDDELRSFEARINAYSDDEVLAIVRDVTARKRAEKAQRESEARFSTAFHDNPVPVAISRVRDGKLIDVNDAFLSMTGHRRAETIGRTNIELGMLADPGAREDVTEAVREHGTVRDFPAQLRRKTGDVLDVLATVTQIELEGEPSFLTTFVDVTERKRLEAELQEMRDDLESKVERRMAGDNPYQLTFREFTVLHLVAAGKADKEIAVELGISVYTVHRHMSKILAKMDSPSRTEAGTRALREGLLD